MIKKLEINNPTIKIIHSLIVLFKEAISCPNSSYTDEICEIEFKLAFNNNATISL